MIAPWDMEPLRIKRIHLLHKHGRVQKAQIWLIKSIASNSSHLKREVK